MDSDELKPCPEVVRLRSLVQAAYIEGIRTEQGALDYPERKANKSWWASDARAALWNRREAEEGDRG